MDIVLGFLTSTLAWKKNDAFTLLLSIGWLENGKNALGFDLSTNMVALGFGHDGWILHGKDKHFGIYLLWLFMMCMPL